MISPNKTAGFRVFIKQASLGRNTTQVLTAFYRWKNEHGPHWVGECWKLMLGFFQIPSDGFSLVIINYSHDYK